MNSREDFTSMRRSRVGSRVIASMGYDALAAVLEIEFQNDGQVVQYMDVPEDVWYKLKGAGEKDSFYFCHISGAYTERRMYVKKISAYKQSLTSL